MTSKDGSLAFAGQVLFIGIDVHAESLSVCLRIGGMELRPFTVTTVAELVKRVFKQYPGAEYRSVYESGFSGFATHRELERAGISNIVVHAADVPTGDKERRNKNDAVDSRKLARELAHGSLRPLHVPSEAQEGLRHLERCRDTIIKQRTRLKNGIKLYLHLLGVRIPEALKHSKWSKRFIQWLESLHFADRRAMKALKFRLQQLRACNEQLQSYEKMLKEELATDPEATRVIKLLQSIPGIGPIAARRLYCELYDIKRFRSASHLASYVGLIPQARSSGDSPGFERVAKRGHQAVRTVMIQAAWIARKHDPNLTARYLRLRQHQVPQKAIVNIAKRLLLRVRAVWISGQDYCLAYETSA